MKPLTEKQAQVLAFLREYVAEHGHFPTYKAMLAGLGYRSPNSIRQHLVALERKGYLTQDDGWTLAGHCPTCGSAWRVAA